MKLHLLKFKIIILTLLLFLFICPFLATAQDSSASTTQSKNGLKLQGWTDQLENARVKTGYASKDQGGPEIIIGKVIKGVLSFMGVVFLCSIVYGGYLWMTAAGNEERIKKSRQILSNASIGLAIVLAAYAITYFVVEKLTAAASLT